MAVISVMISTLFIVALLLFFAGFLAGSESALTSLSRLLIEQLVEDNSKYKKRFDRFVENPARYLNVLLLVRKSCELTATALVATAFVEGRQIKDLLWLNPSCLWLQSHTSLLV